VKFKLTIFFILFIFLSCQKDQSTFIPDQTFLINSDLLLANFVNNPNSYLVTLNEGKTIITDHDKFVLEIPFESLTDSLGNFVKGEIKVEFKDFTQQKSDLIKSPSTIYNSNLLDCKKIIYLNISQGGKSLQIIKEIGMYLKSEFVVDSTRLYIFKFDEGESKWYTENTTNFDVNVGNWSINDKESNIQVFGYKVPILQNGGWFSIAGILPGNYESEKEINIISSPYINGKNTLTFFIANKSNTTFRLFSNKVNHDFSAHFNISDEIIPGKIIMISQFGDNNFQFGISNMLLGLDTELRLVSEEKSLEEIKAILKSL
jgi:hypothetical protein